MRFHAPGHVGEFHSGELAALLAAACVARRADISSNISAPRALAATKITRDLTRKRIRQHALTALAALQLMIGALFAQQPGDSLAAATPETVIDSYEQARSEALNQLRQRYIQDAEAVTKLYLQAGDLERANLASAWGKRLAEPEAANEVDGIAANPPAQDRLLVLQSRYLKEQTDALVRVDKAYIVRVEALQRQVMQSGDLAGANEYAAFLAKLEAEAGVPASKPGAPAPMATAFFGGENLFSMEKQRKWIPTGGTWSWAGTRLTGSGSRSIEYEINLEPPFVALFKYNPKSGIRAALIFDGVGLQNAVAKDKFGLRGDSKFQAEYFPYVHNTVYRCAIVVTRRQSTLYVDGKLICTGPGKDKRVKNISITCGEDASPGSVEVEDLTILRGTDKVPN